MIYVLLILTPVKKFASLTKPLSSVCVEFAEAREVFEPPEGLRGT